MHYLKSIPCNLEHKNVMSEKSTGRREKRQSFKIRFFCNSSWEREKVMRIRIPGELQKYNFDMEHSDLRGKCTKAGSDQQEMKERQAK